MHEISQSSYCQHLESWVMTVGLQVLCTTSTLAVGVNLPARLVVLRGTRRWSSEAGEASGYKEYDRSTCLQMIGRAGRPQFDTHGTAVIMTQLAVSRQLNASLVPMESRSCLSLELCWLCDGPQQLLLLMITLPRRIARLRPAQKVSLQQRGDLSAWLLVYRMWRGTGHWQRGRSYWRASSKASWPSTSMQRSCC